MGVDPLSSVIGEQFLSHFDKLLRLAYGKVLRPSEFAEVLGRAAADLRADADVPAGLRGELGARVQALRTDPTVNRLVRRLLDNADLSVVDELAAHLAGQFASLGEHVDPASAAVRTVGAIERALVASKHTDREAANVASRLAEGRIIEKTRAGFADLGAQIAETSTTTVDSLEEIKRTLGEQNAPRMLTVDWAPDWPRRLQTRRGTPPSSPSMALDARTP